LGRNLFQWLFKRAARSLDQAPPWFVLRLIAEASTLLRKPASSLGIEQLTSKIKETFMAVVK
jgi:hypothetical protein